MNAMEIRGLCKTYPAFTLKDVSFAVPQGAVMGFIGRNGAGKSTTIKSILGLVHPDAGQVEILGRDFARDEKFIKENIGVVLGGIDFYPKKKIAVLTDVTRRFYENWDEEKYRHYLHLFAIDESKRVDQLSSGMQVKYMIALALSHNAKLLILDEPTSGPGRADGAAGTHRRRRPAQRTVLHSYHLGPGKMCQPHRLYQGRADPVYRHPGGFPGPLRLPAPGRCALDPGGHHRCRGKEAPG